MRDYDWLKGKKLEVEKTRKSQEIFKKMANLAYKTNFWNTELLEKCLGSPYIFNQANDVWKENLSEGHFQRENFLEKDREAKECQKNGKFKMLRGIFFFF